MSFEDLMKKGKEKPKVMSSVEGSAEASVEGSVDRVKHEKKTRVKIDGNMIVNEVIKWVKNLDANEYPSMSGVIKRVQRFKRYSFLEDSIRLFLEYLKQNNYINM